MQTLPQLTVKGRAWVDIFALADRKPQSEWYKAMTKIRRPRVDVMAEKVVTALEAFFSFLFRQLPVRGLLDEANSMPRVPTLFRAKCIFHRQAAPDNDTSPLSRCPAH